MWLYTDVKSFKCNLQLQSLNKTFYQGTIMSLFLLFFCIMKLTCLGITTWSLPVNSFELPYQFMGWDIRYLWTLVLKNWILNWFGSAHASKAFHFFAVRVKKSFWNFVIRTDTTYTTSTTLIRLFPFIY